MYYNSKLQLVELLHSLIELVSVIDSNKSKYDKFIGDCKLAADYVASLVGKYDCIKKPMIELQSIFTLNFHDYLIEKDRIEEICDQIENEIMEEIETKWRMYFLPYKYSMWNAMESIYDAAKQDLRCEAIVMPLPYTVLNLDGSIQEEVWEVEEFKTFNVANYKLTELEQIQPEFIFIHNGYDECNNLTRIDEKYFSTKLRTYTTHLIYTPYYTFFDVSKEACNRLMLQPGMINADYIIAQSERVKEEYMKRGFEGESVIALGSPKIDKVIEMMEQPPQIPDEWREKLKGRKVVLYTFSLEACFNREWLHKIQSCMESYWNDEDIGLIFRPHPLTISYAAGRNMNMDILTKIYNHAITGDRIVLDTFKDPRYAYMCSDGLMLSGTSSIINEYIGTGKPIYFDLINYETAADESQLCVDFRSLYCPVLKEGEECISAHEAGVAHFFDVAKGRIEDKKKESRKKAFEEGFLNSDGTAGARIYKCIISTIVHKKKI